MTACDTWNCAVSAMVTAEGSPDVLAMPSGSDDFKWVVLRRVVAGSGFVAPDSPFKLEAFPTLTEATARFVTIEDGLKPMLLTAPDGNVVIVMRSQARRHAAAGH